MRYLKVKERRKSELGTCCFQQAAEADNVLRLRGGRGK